MQEDFHYYATYCAAYLAGYSSEESLDIAYSAQFVDMCSQSLLSGLGAPKAAATTQLAFEMADARTDIPGLQNITRIWASFHFLPYDLNADVKKGSRQYKNKYRLICGPNGPLLSETVNLAKGKSLQAAGIAMHVLADTWAHRYFAGTPSFVINNTGPDFYEILPDGSERKIRFTLKSSPDDPGNNKYTGTIFQPSENAVMNLGHGRAGHLPDYSFIKYRYLPSWGAYSEVVKDNPKDYYNAFCQMIYALKTLRDPDAVFETNRYDTEAAAPFREEIDKILKRRRLIASDDWKALGERISGAQIPDFDIKKYQSEYVNAAKNEKRRTFLGRFIIAALRQKSTVTGNIFRTGNKLAGYSLDTKKKGFRGIRDFSELLDEFGEVIDE